MNYEEAIKELNTIYLATEIQRVPVVKEEVQEALKIANECIEKQIPKKPIEDTEYVGWLIWRCPVCGQEVGRVLEPLQHHCECGQAIEWGKVE